jgi:hypothetical protein
LAGFDPVAFVSPAYLDLLPEPELWQTFWLDLGVRTGLEVTLTQGRHNAADLLRREPRLEPYLSAIIETALEGRDIPQLHDFPSTFTSLPWSGCRKLSGRGQRTGWPSL